MELKDTIHLMTSDNYKERFLAEYWQTKIRYEKLKSMVDNYRAGKLTFTPSCSLDLLASQLNDMERYLNTLEVRARVEDILLDGRIGQDV